MYVQLLMVFAVYAVAGYALFRHAPRLARFMLPAAGNAPARLNANAADLQSIAFSVIGVLFVAAMLPTFCVYLGTLFIARPAGYDWWGAREIWRSASQLVLGVGLFLGAPGLSRFWHTLRTGGVQTAP